MVSIAFWSLYFIDRKLIFPKILDSIMPVWLNQILHTLPLVSLLIEAYSTKYKYSSFFREALLNSSFISAYILWYLLFNSKKLLSKLFLFIKLLFLRTLYIAYHSDKWVYPVMKVLSPASRAMFIISNALFSIFLYKMGEYLNSFFWSANTKSAAVNSLKKKE